MTKKFDEFLRRLAEAPGETVAAKVQALAAEEMFPTLYDEQIMARMGEQWDEGAHAMALDVIERMHVPDSYRIIFEGSLHKRAREPIDFTAKSDDEALRRATQLAGGTFARTRVKRIMRVRGPGDTSVIYPSPE